MKEMSGNEIDDALSQLCDGSLSEPQRAALMAALRRSKTAREAYIRHVSLHFWLRSMLYPGEEAVGDQGVSAAPACESRSAERLRLSSWAAAAAVLVIGWSILFVGLSLRSGRLLPPPPIAAALVGTVDCRWSGERRRTVGDMVRSGDVISLESGTVSLLFDSRVRVTAVGPASFQVVSATECDLHRGELVARVLRGGRGFRVTAGTLHVIDRGTEFGVRRVSESDAEVAVFEGEVALCDAQRIAAADVGDEAPLLRKGQTAAVTLATRTSSQVVRVGAVLSAAFTTVIGDEGEWEANSRADPVFEGFSLAGPEGRIDKAAGGVGWRSPWSDSHERSDTATWIVSDGTASNDRAGVGGASRGVSLKVGPSEPVYASAIFELASDEPAAPSLVWLTLFQAASKKSDSGKSSLRAGFGISAREYFCGFGSTEAPVGRFLNERPRGGFRAYATGKATRMIGKIEIDAVGPADRLSVWIDPPAGAREADGAPAEVVTGSLDGGAIDKIVLRFSCQGESTKARVDDVRLGRSWSSVAD